MGGVSIDFMTQLPKWNGCHSHNSRLILQVGKNGSNKNNRDNFRFDEVVFRYVGETPWDALVYHKL